MLVGIHSLLIHGKSIVGVRGYEGDNLFDIEIGNLPSATSENLSRYRQDKILPYGDLLLTEEEYRNNLTVTDRSNDSLLCERVNALIKQGYTREYYLIANFEVEGQGNVSKPYIGMYELLKDTVTDDFSKSSGICKSKIKLLSFTVNKKTD